MLWNEQGGMQVTLRRRCPEARAALRLQLQSPTTRLGCFPPQPAAGGEQMILRLLLCCAAAAALHLRLIPRRRLWRSA